MSRRTPIFNDYSENGYRINAAGCRSSRTEDESIVYNLRHRWPEELKDVSDQQLVNEYDKFAMTDWFGNQDERFLEWLAESET